MSEHTTSSHRPILVDIVRPWPVARALSSHLAAGDLISLARSSTALRASLHGFGLAEPLPNDASNKHIVRDSIHVGLHGTSYWQNLKHAALWKCSSKTHTKGDKVHTCRLCSTLICEACIVRSSFARGKEDTFRNRCRFFCETCWEEGKSSRSGRLALRPSDQLSSWHDGAQTDSQDDVFCTCTLKENGWLCLECKDKQNYEAASNERFKCHGQDCSNHVGPDHEKRRICLWCDKILPRHLGVSRMEWNQKIIEARTRNALSRQADLEEYNRKRLKLMRMSRREMRGDEAVVSDPDADKPQFVRHLDSCCNYRKYISEKGAPDGNAVYNSKRGYWVYSKDFLLEIGERCKSSKQLGRNPNITFRTWSGTSIFGRTIRQYRRELYYLTTLAFRDRNGRIDNVFGKKIETPMTDERAAHWVALKTRILDMAFIQQMEFFQIQAALQLHYGFDLPWAEFKSMLNVWCLTPLWENTEVDHIWMKPPRKLLKVLSPHRNAADVEKKIEHHAARIVERLVLAGYVLPLRTVPNVSDEASHWYDSANFSHSDHLARVHPCPLLEESSDEEGADKSVEAASASLTGRLKNSLRRVNQRRPTRQGDGRAARDVLNGPQRRSDRQSLRDQSNLRHTPSAPVADHAPGLDNSNMPSAAGGAGPASPRTERRSTADALERHVDGPTGETAPASTRDRRSSFSSTSDDFDDDDFSFKSFDSEEDEKYSCSTQRRRPGPSNVANTNDDDWEIVPPPDPEQRTRE